MHQRQCCAVALDRPIVELLCSPDGDAQLPSHEFDPSVKPRVGAKERGLLNSNSVGSCEPQHLAKAAFGSMTDGSSRRLIVELLTADAIEAVTATGLLDHQLTLRAQPHVVKQHEKLHVIVGVRRLLCQLRSPCGKMSLAQLREALQTGIVEELQSCQLLKVTVQNLVAAANKWAAQIEDPLLADPSLHMFG